MIFAAALAVGVTVAVLPIARAADATRGMALYDSRCVACHTTSVHNREMRRAKSFDDVREWVARWNAYLGGDWGPTEMDDVARYVNEKYYGFACPPGICTAGS
jgi:mono/diheme cytochrome c family protein